MKLTKTLALAALVAGGLLAGTALQAQESTNTPPAGTHPGGAGPRSRPDFAKELGLTAEQQPKFKEIMKDAMDKRKALREDTSLSTEDKRAKAKAIQEEVTKQMKELLTAEQFAKWEKMSQANRRPPGGPGGPPAGGGNAPKN